MPYIYPNRADNEAYICERIDLTNVNAYKVMVAWLQSNRPQIRHKNRRKIGVFLDQKKEFSDDGGEALAYLSFDEDTTIEIAEDSGISETFWSAVFSKAQGGNPTT